MQITAHSSGLRPIRCIVINLDRTPERLQKMREQFDLIGFDLHRFRAVDGLAMPDSEINAFNLMRPRNFDPPVPWRPGTIGCFLSHFGVWQEVARSSDPYVAIFEDDLHISSDLRLLLATDSWIPQDYDVIRLETSTNRVRLGAPGMIGGLDRKLHPVKSTTWCAGAYILSREAARKFVSVSPLYHYPVDYMMFSLEDSPVARSLTVGQVLPAPCVQDKYLPDQDAREDFESTVQIDDATGSMTGIPALFARLPRAAYKLFLHYRKIPYRA